jgi:hypothetical protein
VTQIPADFYDFLRELEEKLTHVIKSVGKIEHTFWRSFNTDIKTEPCEGFIDGDLVESFLDLSHNKMREVSLGLQVSNLLDISYFSILCSHSCITYTSEMSTSYIISVKLVPVSRTIQVAVAQSV